MVQNINILKVLLFLLALVLNNNGFLRCVLKPPLTLFDFLEILLVDIYHPFILLLKLLVIQGIPLSLEELWLVGIVATNFANREKKLGLNWLSKQLYLLNQKYEKLLLMQKVHINFNLMQKCLPQRCVHHLYLVVRQPLLQHLLLCLHRLPLLLRL